MRTVFLGDLKRCLRQILRAVMSHHSWHATKKINIFLLFQWTRQPWDIGVSFTYEFGYIVQVTQPEDERGRGFAECKSEENGHMRRVHVIYVMGHDMSPAIASLEPCTTKLQFGLRGAHDTL